MTGWRKYSLLLAALTAFSSYAKQPEDWQLEKVVEVTRHGVRPPVAWDRRAMETGTARSWPHWQTRDGELTGHGYTAAWLKGRVEGEHYRRLGLIAAGCPTEQQVYIYTSPLQRTRETAKALSEGAFPGCQLSVHYQSDGNDPLFLTGNQTLNLDPARARQAVLQAMGGSAAAAQRRWQPATERLAHAVCQTGQPCPLFNTPWQLNISDDGKLSIPSLDHQAAIAETLRLAWSENQPAEAVAFGAVHQQRDLTPLLALNSAKYDYSNDVPYIARRGGSALMAQILAALDPQNHSAPGQRWLMLVAHDNNIAYLRTLLRFSWQQSGYPRGSIPPAASLVFERWRNRHSGQRFVRILFRAQRLAQIRQLQPLQSVNDLLQSEFSAPGCRASSVGRLCPLADTLLQVNDRLDPALLVPFRWPSSVSHSDKQQ